jgi:light-regulated signal transduction histidine kinase (bacteriophytochrome)
VILDLFGAGLDAQCREFIGVILSESIAMNDLIDTLLDFSRVACKEISPSRTDLSELATVAAAGLRMREPQYSINFEIAPGIAADCDPDLLRVVLDNLLGNAYKYSGRKEEALIEFGVSGSDGEQVYFVRDNGAGFDMAQAGRLFSAFQRLHSEHEFKGFGIGLATVQRIIQRHGGKVWAEGAVGKGATFYFTLP